MFEVLDTPIKSESDDKNYSVIKLKNGLVACLISDFDSDLTESDYDTDSESNDSSYKTISNDFSCEESPLETDSDSDSDALEQLKPKREEPNKEKMAAVSLTIRAGSFYDPEHIEGLAHFLEHMVFMGSEKFPNENDFGSFISQCGGEDNAVTDCETTTFYFDCFLAHFDEALHKFAQFFIKPIFNRNSIERELNAIDSEFQIASVNNHTRIEQLLCHISKKKSPVNKFFWGNLKSLKENVNEDELYLNLRKFHEQYYTADRFTIAIQAELPIKRLEKLVISNFSKLPTNINNKVPVQLENFSESVFHTPQFQRIYYVEAIGNLNEIHIAWPIFAVFPYFKSKPDEFLSSLFGDETEGSIFHHLKNENLATGIIAGCDESDGFENNSYYALFSIVISLTELGCSKINYILDVVFSYINLLKSQEPSEVYFKELQTMGDIEFKYTDEEDPSEFVEKISHIMQYVPPKYYLSYFDCFHELDSQAIKDILNRMTPNNMNISILMTKKITEDYEIEEWFGIKFKSEEISTELKNKWSNITPLKELHLPKPNIFIANDFELLVPSKLFKVPVKVFSNSFVEIWHKADRDYELPTAIFNFYFYSNVAYKSAKSAVCLQLFALILNYQLNDVLYMAGNAGLECKISVIDSGLFLMLSGYNEKLLLLLEIVLKQFRNVLPELNNQIFETNKEHLLKRYFNKSLSPEHLAKQIRLSLTISEFKITHDKYNVLNEITIDDLKNVFDEFLNNFHVRSLIQGNFPEESVPKLYNLIRENVNDLSKLKKRNFSVQSLELPIGENHFCTTSLNSKNPNSVILNYYQTLDNSILGPLMIDLFAYLIEEPIFDKLRTKESLCYHIRSATNCTYGTNGLSIIMTVDANKFELDYADKKIESFLCEFLSNLDDKNLEKAIKGLMKIKSIPLLCLEEEVGENWFEIVSNQFQFERKSVEIKLLQKMTCSDFKKWIKRNLILKNSDKVRKISVQVNGHKVEKTKTKLSSDITDKSKSLNPVFFSGLNSSIRYILNHREFISKLKLRK